MTKIRHAMFAALAVTSLSACGSGGHDSASQSGTGAASSAAAAPSAPEKLALLEEFRTSAARGCADHYLELNDDDGEFAGATVQLCQGQISSEEPYTILLVKAGNAQVETGSMIFYFRNDRHPMAYSEIKDIIFAAAGIRDQDEEQRLRSSLSRFQLAAPNMPGTDYRPLHTANSGAVVTVAANEPAAGWLAVRVRAPAG